MIFNPFQCVFHDAVSRKQIGHGFIRGKLYYFPIKQQAVSNVVGVSSMSTAM